VEAGTWWQQWRGQEAPGRAYEAPWCWEHPPRQGAARKDAVERRHVLVGYRSLFRVTGSWYDKWSATWLGRERRDRPERPLATRGDTGLRHGGHRTRRRRGCCPGAGDSTRRRRTGEATAFRLVVLHLIDPSVVVSSDGGGQWRQRWCRALVAGRGRCRALVALAMSSAAVSEVPTNAGRAPKFGRFSLSDLRYGVVFLHMKDREGDQRGVNGSQ
jgi:hypothetical protein